MHVPLDIYYAVTITGFQFGCNRTCAFVNLYLILVINIPESVITWNRMTTARELIRINVLLRDVYRFLLVELLRNDEEILLRYVFFLLFAYERHELTPSGVALLFLVLTIQFIDVLLPQQYGLLSQCYEEVITFLYVVELCQLVCYCRCHLEVVFLEELLQYILSNLLYLSVVTSQDSLYLCLCLRRRHEVYP